MADKIRVLVIDDSALIRQLLTQMLNSTKDIEVVGTAGDPCIAERKIQQLKPDVLTLDIEMPRMDGLNFLKNLMQNNPMPVLMISALTQKGADAALQALEYGAVDYIGKPSLDVAKTFKSYTEEIVEKIRVAARTRCPSVTHKSKAHLSTNVTQSRHLQPLHLLNTLNPIIAIGASTGGIEAIREILEALPANTPGIVISQHIPAAFSTMFSLRMNRLSKMIVTEAKDGAVILPGHVFIAPGSHHLTVARDGTRYICRLDEGPPVNRHRPSVDVLFHSMAISMGLNGIGVILTGMGCDGAAGLKAMHKAGAITIAQDEMSSIVWGMPGEAVKCGAVDRILPLEQIAETLKSLAQRTNRSALPSKGSH